VLGVELHGDAFSFGIAVAPPTPATRSADDFRDIRHVVFGPEEPRTLADFRRSVAQEAFAGDAQP
jgi:hypothetical protein